MILHFNPTNYLRLEEPRAIGTSAAGASFATSTGDILEVTSYGPGVFRLRIGPRTRPDYGIVVGRSKSCTVAQPDVTLTTFGAGDATLEITGGPLAFRLLWKGAPVATSITDQHFRGYTRLPAFGRIKQGGEWAAALALSSGEPVYGLGEKFGPLDKRGQLIHSQVEDALGGTDFRTLYVTSARQERPADELERLPQSGGLFAMRVDVPGLPEPSFAG